MAKLTLADLATTLSNNAASTINDNNALIEAALENTLSRDGTTPNQLLSDLDMNNNDILNIKSIAVESLTIAGESINGLITEVEGYRDDALTSASDAADSASESASYANLANDAADEAASSAVTAGNAETSAQGYAASAQASALDAETAADTVNTLWTNLQGGLTGQVMQKDSGTDYDFSWVYLAGTGDMVKSVYDPQNINADAFARANHTGTQSADTIVDGTTNKTYTATEKTKLAGIATGATANLSDATLLARANHTGTQAISTVSGLQAALDSKLAGSAVSAYGLTLIDDADAATARTTLGLGSLSTVNTINNANWSGTDLALINGGTGASDAATARTNLGLVIGTNVQAFDAGLQSIAGLTTAADTMIYTTAADTYATTSLTSTARSLLDDTSVSAMRTTLGVGSARISRNVPSNVAQLDITVPTGYDSFDLRLVDFIPVTNAVTISMRFSTDGGSTFYSTAGNYLTASANGAAGNSWNPFINGTTDTQINIHGSTSNTYGLNAVLNITPGSASTYANVSSCKGSPRNDVGQTISLLGATLAVTGRITTIRLFCSSGNISSGIVTLIGYN